MLKISLVIPSYRRPRDLKNCLEAVKKQARKVDELIVVIRSDDEETFDLLENIETKNLPLKVFSLETPGVIAAMNLGLKNASGDIIAFTDDDSIPHASWIERIQMHFESDKMIGGVGGRDWIHQDEKIEDKSSCSTIGQVQWFGRVIGNHHLNVVGVRNVDVLKGVNMSFRKSAINNLLFDERLLGTGAQVHFELAFCLKLRKAGWTLVYDPLVAVDHYPSQRFDEDKRNTFSYKAYRNAVHNETLALMEYFPFPQKIIFLLWAVFLGTRDAFGLVQWLRFFLQDMDVSTPKLLSSLHGRYLGVKTWWRYNFSS